MESNLTEAVTILCAATIIKSVVSVTILKYVATKLQSGVRYSNDVMFTIL